MKSNYSEVPKRLLEYRKIAQKNQEEMGRQFAVNQSHYYKLETGTKIISYKSLKAFENHGGDVCYLITGTPHYYGITDEYVHERKTLSGKIETINLILWLVKQGLYLCDEASESLDETWKYVRLMEVTSDTSIWKNIRMVENISQMEMAQKLDINIKRYRRIEKLEMEPDAEILLSLYKEFGYSPMIILNRNLYSMSEINRIWDAFPDDIKLLLRKHLDSDMQLIIQNEKDSK